MTSDLFRNKGNQQLITGFKNVGYSSSLPTPPRLPLSPPEAIVFTFSKPSPATPQRPTPQLKIVAARLPKAPFLTAYDEVMARLFRRELTPLDGVIRYIYSRYPTDVLPVSLIVEIASLHGISIPHISVLITCGVVNDAWNQSPRPWGFFFPYFTSEPDGLQLSHLFKLVTE
jgi:hypothetical protein